MSNNYVTTQLKKGEIDITILKQVLSAEQLPLR